MRDFIVDIAHYTLRGIEYVVPYPYSIIAFPLMFATIILLIVWKHLQRTGTPKYEKTELIMLLKIYKVHSL